MTARLMQAFAFTADDLATNRQGKLTVHQQEKVAQHVRLARNSSMLAFLASFGSLIVFAGVMFLTAKESPIPSQALPYLAGTAFVFLALVCIFIFLGLRRLHDLRAEKITTISGSVHLTTKRFQHRRWTGYYAQINDLRFQLTSEQQFEGLAEGKVYQIYFIHYPPTHLILSLEEKQ